MGPYPPMGTPLKTDADWWREGLHKPFRVDRVQTMDPAEKRKQQQREYYHRNLDKLRAKAKIYRQQWTPEQKQRKRERDLAYYHRTKTLIARKRRTIRRQRTDDQKERERQQRRVRNKRPEAQEKHRQHSKKFYDRYREAILSRQRAYYRNHSQEILRRQREYKQQRKARRMEQWEPLHALAEICQQEWNGMFSGPCSNASTSVDVSVYKTSPST